MPNSAQMKNVQFFKKELASSMSEHGKLCCFGLAGTLSLIING